MARRALRGQHRADDGRDRSTAAYVADAPLPSGSWPPSPPRRLATPSSVNAAIKQIADVMRRANYAGALQYVPELSWILFLRILDEREQLEAEEAEAVGRGFTPSLEAPFRWRDWAAPDGAKRAELTDGAMGAFLPFVNGELLPYLRGLRDRPARIAAPEGHQPGRVGGRQGRVDTERNLLDILDRVARDPPRGRRPDPRLHASPGLRGPAAQDGREEQRRRPVLHAARGHPGDGPGHRPQGRRDGLRPGLRHRRLPRAGVRVHARAPGPGRDRGRPADAARGHVLGPREGRPRLPDRARQPGPPRHRPAAHLARQHADRPGGLRRPVRRRAATSST